MFSQPVDGPGKLRKQVWFCMGQREQASRNGSGWLSEPPRCCSCRGPPRTARCRAQGRRGRGERRVGDGGGGEPCPVRKGHWYPGCGAMALQGVGVSQISSCGQGRREKVHQPPIARAHLHPTLGSTAPHRTWPPLSAPATLTPLRSSSNLQRKVRGRSELPLRGESCGPST